MAMFRDDGGKTEKPTAQRLTQAAGKGQVPLSKEFTMAGTLLIAVIVIASTGHWLMDALADVMTFGLNVNLAEHLIRDDSQPDALLEVYRMLRTIALPLLFWLFSFVAATALTGYGQIGFKFRWGALKMGFSKLNPVGNLGKLFKFSSIIRTAISALKLAVLGSVLYFVLSARMPEFAMMYENSSFAESVGIIASTAFEVVTWICVCILILALGDIAWQRYDYIETLKMDSHRGRRRTQEQRG